MRFVFLVLVFAASAFAAPFKFTVLHTNDLHSHVEGNGPDAFLASPEKQKWVRGHYARLTALIAQLRKEKSALNEPLLVVDAGDFFSGTLFHALTPSASPASPEMEFFAVNGYDAIALGNHEFDAGVSGLLRIVDKARAHGLGSKLLASNLKSAKYAGLLPVSLVKELDSDGRRLRVGILGFLGVDAARVSGNNRGDVAFAGYDDTKGKDNFSELAELAKTLAAELRAKEKVDVVLALIHGGDGEDTNLVKVAGVDLVISGHTHDLYEVPKKEGGKLVAQAGSYGRYLGRLELEFDKGQVTLRSNLPTHVAIDDKIAFDPEMLRRIEGYKKELDGPLAATGFHYASPIVDLKKTIPHVTEPNAELGVFVTSLVRQELNRRVTEPVDLYFTSMGVIREPLSTVEGQPTPHQFSDIFRVLPLGFGPQGEIGGPVRSVYLAKADVWKMMNFLEIYRHFSSSFCPAYSDSLKYRVRSWGVPFVNRIAELTLHGKSYSQWPELIHVATNEFVSGFFDKLPALSKGMVKLVARDKHGQPISTFHTPKVPPEPALFAEGLKKSN